MRRCTVPKLPRPLALRPVTAQPSPASTIVYYVCTISEPNLGFTLIQSARGAFTFFFLPISPLRSCRSATECVLTRTAARFGRCVLKHQLERAAGRLLVGQVLKTRRALRCVLPVTDPANGNGSFQAAEAGRKPPGRRRMQVKAPGGVGKGRGAAGGCQGPCDWHWQCRLGTSLKFASQVAQNKG
jgi:hypothetical protein